MRTWFGRFAPGAADGAVLALAAWWLARLAAQAAGARFQTDECFHAQMSVWIATHRTLPHTIPELYSGFAYFYPPLFHVVGAVWAAVWGEGALRYLNVFVSGLLVLTILVGARSLGAPAAGRWACALGIANQWVSVHAVRLYVEQFTTLLTIAALFLMLHLARIGGWRVGAMLGIVIGLALMTKQWSLTLLAALGVIAVFAALRRDTRQVRAFGMAAGIALLVAAPMLVRNQVLYGSAIYPALAPDLHPLLHRLNQTQFTTPPRDFYLQAVQSIGVAIELLVLAALVLAAVRRRLSFELGLLGGCLALYLAAPLMPMLDARHMLPVLVAMAVLGAMIVTKHLEGQRLWRVAIEIALLVNGAVFVARMPNYRSLLDVPPEAVEAFQAVRDHVPADQTVLSLYTYDTYYYSGRPATWPIPWGQKDPPVEMFLTSDCDSVYRALENHRLRYLLVSRDPQGETFDGTNYPRPFVECMAALAAQGRIAVLWYSDRAVLARVEGAR
jgi:hypothetical protein